MLTMKRNKILLIIFIAITYIFTGCATAPKGAIVVEDPSEVPSVQEKFRERLSSVKIGMTLDEFKKLFPEAYVGGQNKEVTAYEIKDVQKYITEEDLKHHNAMWGFGSPKSRTATRYLWFYFYDDKLVKWGRPQDWPKEADFIIEKRYR